MSFYNFMSSAANASLNRGPNPVGGWVELGRTTLGSASSTITVSSLADKRYYMVLVDGQPNSTGDKFYRLGNGSADSGSNYARRYSSDGGADGTGTSLDKVIVTPNGASNLPNFDVSYIANLSGNEKLVITHNMGQQTAGATTAPSRRENVWKWVNTSNPLDIVSFQSTGTNAYATGSEVVVLGWDPADTHTNNFWEELASVSGTGSSTNLSSGTITAKKYLWVQFFEGNYTSSTSITFNNDTGNNYARRGSLAGATDFTLTSQSAFTPNVGGNQGFLNMFIINNASNEKLCICHSVDAVTDGATTAPSRKEEVDKWANTSNQITEIDFDGGANYPTNAILKVWGAD